MDAPRKRSAVTVVTPVKDPTEGERKPHLKRVGRSILGKSVGLEIYRSLTNVSSAPREENGE